MNDESVHSIVNSVASDDQSTSNTFMTDYPEQSSGRVNFRPGINVDTTKSTSRGGSRKTKRGTMRPGPVFDDLVYPKGFVKPTIQPESVLLSNLAPSPKPKVGNNQLDVRLQGFPGGLQLNATDAKKYFGGKAKEEFYERYRTMTHQRLIAGTDPNNELTRLLYEEAKQLEEPSHFSFAPNRAGNTNNVKISSKVVIRSQTLDTAQFSEARLVPVNMEKMRKSQIPTDELYKLSL